MSDAAFPSLPGLTWDIARTPMFRTMTHESASGREQRAALWSYPRWKWSLSYELLRDDATAELRTLMGFFLARQGSFDSFRYADPDDSAVTGQAIATGDGTATAFQLVRAYGGFIEPVTAVETLTLYKAGSAVAPVDFTLGSTGIVTFATAPTAGAAITADMTYSWRVRFQEDQAEFNQFMHKLWELQKLEFVSVK